MITLTVQCHYHAERFAVAQASASVRHLRHLATDAPDGTVLPTCARAALDRGRVLPRDTLTAAL